MSPVHHVPGLRDALSPPPPALLTPVLVRTASMTEARSDVELLDASDPNQRTRLEHDLGIVGCVVTEEWLARFDAACRTMRELAEEAMAQPRFQIVRVTRVKLGDEIVADTEHPAAKT